MNVLFRLQIFTKVQLLLLLLFLFFFQVLLFLPLPLLLLCSWCVLLAARLGCWFSIFMSQITSSGCSGPRLWGSIEGLWQRENDRIIRILMMRSFLWVSVGPMAIWGSKLGLVNFLLVWPTRTDPTKSWRETGKPTFLDGGLCKLKSSTPTENVFG